MVSRLHKRRLHIASSCGAFRFLYEIIHSCTFIDFSFYGAYTARKLLRQALCLVFPLERPNFEDF